MGYVIENDYKSQEIMITIMITWQSVIDYNWVNLSPIVIMTTPAMTWQNKGQRASMLKYINRSQN